MVDSIEESILAERNVRTTRNGIGPAIRAGIHVAELFDQELFESQLRTLAKSYKA